MNWFARPRGIVGLVGALVFGGSGISPGRDGGRSSDPGGGRPQAPAPRPSSGTTPATDDEPPGEVVRRLLEDEVPEVADGSVLVRWVGRLPGRRAKVLVSATRPGVDAVACCVGADGSRLARVCDRLGGDRVDIVRWDASLQVLIPAALAPARTEEVLLCGLLNRAIVLVREDQLAPALGRDGQNVLLACNMLGWDIEVMTAGELEHLIDRAIDAFSRLEGIDHDVAEHLVEQGMLSDDDLASAAPGPLARALNLDEKRLAPVIEQAKIRSGKKAGMSGRLGPTGAEARRQGFEEGPPANRSTIR